MPLTKTNPPQRKNNNQCSSGGYPPHLLGSLTLTHTHTFPSQKYEPSSPCLHLLFFSPPLSPATNLLSLPLPDCQPQTPLRPFQKLKRNCYCSTLLLKDLLCHVINNIIILLEKIFMHTCIQQLLHIGYVTKKKSNICLWVMSKAHN